VSPILANQDVYKDVYKDVQLFIDGIWCDGSSKRTLDIIDPGSDEIIGQLAHADIADLDRALNAASRAFNVWRNMPGLERSAIMRKAAQILRNRAEEIMPLVTFEQGKPLVESRGEIEKTAEILGFFAEETTRSFGRIIPARTGDVLQMVIREPVGPVAAFTPWNFPLNQLARKIGASLSAGCSMVAKASEETPASAAALVSAFAEAGLPAGTLNLVFGIPDEVSSHLIASPVIRKVSFTGSTAVGKQLAALAGSHMKRVTMELGGHAPAIVFDDANVSLAVKILSANKFRNAGQSCISPTRFLVHDKVYEEFVQNFVAYAQTLHIGHGMDPETMLGPLANGRRVQAIEALVADAREKGALVATGGERLDRKGSYFLPTVLTNVPKNARIMNEEPFGPVAIISSFNEFSEAILEANRLPYGLGAYVYTSSLKTAHAAIGAIESGMVSINHHGFGHPEVPFGGVKDSGYGSEGGSEAVDAYLNTKFATLDAI
jgi:succinate-semialdehyde dehydrogenase / glutarate-semialdehyde dehydrogenase